METDSGSTRSFWMDTARMPSYDPLQRDLDTEVCIVGAGIAGVTTAYLLAHKGRRVVLLDDGPIAGGETCRTTAHLVFALDDFYEKIEEMHGSEGARIAAESHKAAVDRIEAIVREEKIDCEFERLDGYWFAEDESGHDLDPELPAAQRAGVDGVERVAQIPDVPFKTKVALRFPDQAQFHPLKYIAALTKAIERDGGMIFCDTHVESLDKGDRAQVQTSDGHTVTADAIVFATNSPVNDWVKIHTKQAAYRTYVIGARVARGTIPRRLYWDNLDPYHYIRLATLDENSEILIVGGEDHKTGQADDDEAERFGILEQWSRERFPMIDDVLYRWSGQVLEPIDYMAFIGRNPGDENIYVATGDSGNGMTHGTIAGILITDLITGRENPWSKLYDPARKSLRATPAFLRENLNVAAQYGDLATPGEISSPEELRNDSGAIMRRGTRKIAVYKDVGGEVHMHSAVCPHLYCIVDWNDTERTWDCPCHGSRFDRYGKVINGPAITDLSEVPAEVPATKRSSRRDLADR